MAFTQMWLWSLKKYGPVELVDEILVPDQSSLIQITEETLSIIPQRETRYGQIIFDYGQNINTVTAIDNFQINNNGTMLKSINDFEGLGVIEFATSNKLTTSLGFDFKKSHNEDLDVRIRYTFFDDNFNIIESKDSVINQIKIPSEFSLMKNYPNPFNPKTNIQFSVPEHSFVKLFIYDINGKTISKIINSELEIGHYKVSWNGTNELGRKVGSGVYIYRLQAKNFTSSQKMIFIK
tara:strand:- start:50 stop:757 length:708 start_codon:yes stop_codon:yes gene_type:complete